ncbi:MAG: HNH endonuclease [Fimbriimonadales bacterium]|nr:HNH endonuclease [Fimbriimonadales bacterium]
MPQASVLVLNGNYEPLNVCTLRRAVSLVMLGKAEPLVFRSEALSTVSGPMPAPSVVRLHQTVRRPIPMLRLSRHSVLARDRYTCQYCGSKGSDLTIDHVVPKRRGGQDTWDNLVACCRRCNLMKGDKTPQQARMNLLRQPSRPHYVPYISLPQYLRARREPEWSPFLPRFDAFEEDLVPA